ncbi:MAG: multidrug efflux RND transporter permease subunit [Filomicrobium sp.]
MNLGRFFIDRPVFAIALSVAVIIVGAVAAMRLPISQYPEVVPPTVTVSAQYPGASAKTIADTVATPIEQEVNGVEGMLYMQSQSAKDGTMNLAITFAIGTDLDKAQVLVQNRVALAEARLPEVVRRIGISVRKNSPDFLAVVQLTSPDKSRDQLYLSNYATQRVLPVLSRLEGVGSVTVIGARDYAMRIWLDPDRIASYDMTAGDVISALRAQNIEVAGGVLAQPPVANNRSFQPTLSLQGRLSEPDEFEQIIVKRGDDGRVVRLADVARAELGARDYSTNAYMNGEANLAILVFQQPGTNALATSEAIQKTMAKIGETLPAGVQYHMTYNPTEFFVRTSIDALTFTIYEAIALVVFVIVVFLQNGRAAFIPLVAIPISLVGTFAVMAGLGYSINTLTLFGLVLAVGIVVDDAIVVVENVERYLRQGFSPKDAARKTMDEVSSALVSMGLVLSAVFVPTMLLDGITGEFFRQFAVVIATATLISVTVSLTLAPALSAVILKSHDTHSKGSWLSALLSALARGFNWIFDRMADGYAATVRGTLWAAPVMLVSYVVLIGAAAYLFMTVPRGFVPAADQGYLIVTAQLPAGASLQRTDKVMKEIASRAKAVTGVRWTHTFPGRDLLTGTNLSNAGVTFVQFDYFEDRKSDDVSLAAIRANLEKAVADINEARLTILAPPTIRGIGAASGYSLRVQDYDNQGPRALEQATQTLLTELRADPQMMFAFSPYSASSPEIYIDVDRTKAEMLGVPTERVVETVETYIGSTYVNDFNLLGRTYQVIAQAESVDRLDVEQLAKLKTRSDAGTMVPLGSVATFRTQAAPDRVPRYNLFPTAAVIGAFGPSVSSQDALERVELIAATALPPGFGIEWTELSYQERLAEGGLVLFLLAIVFVYLVLAANYESWTLPIAVLLIVPMSLLSALAGLQWMGMDNNLLTQIGLVVLVGLAAKNAILIVEFARDLEAQGRSMTDAVVEASRLRLRPILMTSMAFVLGVVPLMTATGPGAELRQAIGTAVFFGMLGVTLFGLFFTPVFYALVRGMELRFSHTSRKSKSAVIEEAFS